MTPEQARQFFEMFANPEFMKHANAYFSLLQQQGLEAAQKFWSDTLSKTAASPAVQMQEHLHEFYKAMGYVPLAKFEEMEARAAQLATENQALRDTIAELRLRLVAEQGAQAQQVWQEVLQASMDKQLALGREFSQNWLDAFQQSEPQPKQSEKPAKKARKQ